MSSCSKQIGGGEARIEAREALELDRLNGMNENELYDELLAKYQNSYGGDKGKAIKRLNKMENRGKDEYIKEWNKLYDRTSYRNEHNQKQQYRRNQQYTQNQHTQNQQYLTSQRYKKQEMINKKTKTTTKTTTKKSGIFKLNFKLR